MRKLIKSHGKVGLYVSSGVYVGSIGACYLTLITFFEPNVVLDWFQTADVVREYLPSVAEGANNIPEGLVAYSDLVTAGLMAEFLFPIEIPLVYFLTKSIVARRTAKAGEMQTASATPEKNAPSEASTEQRASERNDASTRSDADQPKRRKRGGRRGFSTLATGNCNLSRASTDPDSAF
eukprot:CAMPEP_0175163350 /NCGR_PEP_ID=MMETSP0087-20121206/25707_1 /TAXON_ID=136419 /ORGANISM="Unknown Unknown, Strain D1" /LENGTH=178 /DNA_ID=CAMNT_0016452057 /DNA_START=228 /DNA_END=761 /DNA_ORIENTATION=+